MNPLYIYAILSALFIIATVAFAVQYRRARVLARTNEQVCKAWQTSETREQEYRDRIARMDELMKRDPTTSLKPCEHKLEEIRDIVVLRMGTGDNPDVYLHRDSQCWGRITDGEIASKASLRVDVMLEYFKGERIEIAEAVKPWMDMRPIGKGESPILVAITAMKDEIAGWPAKLTEQRRIVDHLRTQLWGRACYFHDVEEETDRPLAAGRAPEPDGRPACRQCLDMKAWEIDETNTALEEAIRSV